MKTILFTLLILPLTTFNQPNFNAVIAALQKADMPLLTEHLDNNVEIVINDSDGSYSKAQAATLIKNFLSKNKPSICSIAHSGSARDQGSYYCIGKMVAGGRKYRINIFFKEVNSKYLIQEMRIEED